MIPKKFVVDNSGKERQKISSRKTFIKYFSKKFLVGCVYCTFEEKP